MQHKMGLNITLNFRVTVMMLLSRSNPTLGCIARDYTAVTILLKYGHGLVGYYVPFFAPSKFCTSRNLDHWLRYNIRVCTKRYNLQ